MDELDIKHRMNVGLKQELNTMFSHPDTLYELIPNYILMYSLAYSYELLSNLSYYEHEKYILMRIIPMYDVIIDTFALHVPLLNARTEHSMLLWGIMYNV